MAKIGFARVSTREQYLTEQVEQLKKAGCIKIFEGKNSGKKDTNALRLKELLNYVRHDDIVIVTKLDRLGRSTMQVLNAINDFNEKGVGFKTLDGSIDTTKKNDPISTALLQVLAMVAELERNFIVSRTQEGRIRTGKKGGRPRALSDGKFAEFKKDLKKGFSISMLMSKYQLSEATVVRYKRKLK